MSDKRSVSIKDNSIALLPITHGNKEKRQATEIVNRLKYAQRSSSYLFRGLSDCQYDLIPSIARNRYMGKEFSIKDEKIVFRAIKNQGIIFMRREGLSDIDLLALAQHFGAPTRLLDWTTNPLVALYFSLFSGRLIDDQRDGIVYVYKSENNEFIRSKDDMNNLNTSDDDESLFQDRLFSGKVRFVLPKFVDERIRNQNGLFSLQQDPVVSFSQNCAMDRLWKLSIPKKVKVTLARYLHGLGITHDLIMPDFGGFCQTLNYRYHYNVGIRSRGLDVVEQADEEH